MINNPFVAPLITLSALLTVTGQASTPTAQSPPEVPVTIQGVIILILMAMVPIAQPFAKSVVSWLNSKAAKNAADTEEKVSGLEVFKKLTAQIESLQDQIDTLNVQLIFITQERDQKDGALVVAKAENQVLTNQVEALRRNLETEHSLRVASDAALLSAQEELRNLKLKGTL